MGQPGLPGPPGQMPTGQLQPGPMLPPQMAPQMAPQPPPQPQPAPPNQYPQTNNSHLLKPGQKEAVEKLVGLPSEMNPPNCMPQRRDFFEQLVLLNEKNGESLTAPPQVSKSTVDLHRLYIAVRKAQGFKKVSISTIFFSFRYPLIIRNFIMVYCNGLTLSFHTIIIPGMR